MSDQSRTRYNVVRSYKKYLANAENSALHSTGFEQELFLKRAARCKLALDRLQQMTDIEFDSRFVFGTEKLGDLENT